MDAVGGLFFFFLSAISQTHKYKYHTSAFHMEHKSCTQRNIEYDVGFQDFGEVGVGEILIKGYRISF